MALKNRQQTIPGGFDWTEPKTGWSYRSDIFTTTRDAIIQHRLANPQHGLRTDDEHVEFEMEQRYTAKLRAMRGGEQWLAPTPEDASPPVFRTPRSRGEPAAGGKVENASQGIGVMVDWLGSGLRPVESELASKRAKICSECPLNIDGDFWQRMEGMAAQAVKLLVKAKNNMKLNTPSDDALKSCGACDCWLATKVWVPLPHILAHTKKETMAKLDKNCWITRETV